MNPMLSVPSPQDPIHVCIDRDLEDLIPIFLANRRKDLEKLRTALSQKDFETIGMLGHRMKGDGGGYGFQAITEIGRTMELAAGRHDQPAIGQALAQLEDFLSRVTVDFQ